MSEKIMELVVWGDYNDADYVENTVVVSQEELDRLMPIIDALKKANASKRHLDEFEKDLEKEFGDDWEEFKECYVPYPPDGCADEIHTINNIQLVTYTDKTVEDLLPWPFSKAK